MSSGKSQPSKSLPKQTVFSPPRAKKCSVCLRISYLFDKKGVIVLEKEETKLSEDDLMLLAIEAGAENFETGDDYYEITTSPEDFSSVRETLEKEGLTFAEADIQMVPQTYITLDAEASRKMGLLIENLEDLDDVLEVYHNWEEA